MFCSKCGKELEVDAVFCPACGNKVGAEPKDEPRVTKVILDPAEVMPEKKVADSSTSLKGQGGTIGIILMILSVVLDLVAMFAIGFDAFIPITIGATVVFVIGLLMRIFSC